MYCILINIRYNRTEMYIKKALKLNPFHSSEIMLFTRLRLIRIWRGDAKAKHHFKLSHLLLLLLFFVSLPPPPHPPSHSLSFCSVYLDGLLYNYIFILYFVCVLSLFIFFPLCTLYTVELYIFFSSLFCVTENKVIEVNRHFFKQTLFPIFVKLISIL